MKKYFSFSMRLGSNQFHAGLTEICTHFQDFQSDDYLNGLVRDVDDANQTLFKAMHIASVRRSVQQESKLLTERIVAATRYVDSCRYVADAEVRKSAEALMTLFRYDKPFSLMKVDTRLGAVSTLLRDLQQPDVQVHLARLTEMSDRITGIEKAWNTLKAKRLEVDQSNSAMLKGMPLPDLKRDAAAKLERLVDYLKAMAEKEPATYGGHYAVVTEIIKRLNATMHRSTYLRVEVELEDNEDTTEELQPTAVSA